MADETRRENLQEPAVHLSRSGREVLQRPLPEHREHRADRLRLRSRHLQGRLLNRGRQPPPQTLFIRTLNSRLGRETLFAPSTCGEIFRPAGLPFPTTRQRLEEDEMRTVSLAVVSSRACACPPRNAR